MLLTRVCFVGDPLPDNARQPEPEPAEPERPASSAGGSEFERSQSGAPSSEFSHSQSGAPSSEAAAPRGLDALASLYERHSTATAVRLPVVPPAAQQVGTGRGTLLVPGWVRERAAEVLFAGGDVDEGSVAEAVLDALLKVLLVKLVL
jgi:actin-related protein 10